MEYYIKVTQRKVTTRIALPTDDWCTRAKVKFAALPKGVGVTVEPGVFTTSGFLVRSRSEERTACRLLELIV